MEKNWNKMTYQEAVDYIEDTPRFTKKNTMENTKAILRHLGSPEERMKIIHVAGTNGKGSVCAFLSSILTTAGKHTGLFISPHLVRINERFQIDQQPVSDREFLDAFHRVMSCVEEIQKQGLSHPTYFEILFLMGMVLFEKAGVEYLVMETGLGGRLDATNAVEHPLAAVITSISLDHTEYLGDTIELIAGEKAGIIKRGIPVIFDGSCQASQEVIKDRAEALEAPLYAVCPSMYKILHTTNKHIDFSIESGYYEYVELSISSVAEYQVMNAALAVTAVKVIDKNHEFTNEIIQKGIAAMKWQGRMETVLPNVILDGAHNEAGVAEFVKTARRLEADYPVTLLFAAVSDKDYTHMIETICRELHLKTVIVTEVGGYRAVDAGVPAGLFRSFCQAEILEYQNVEEAFEKALKVKGDGILFCVGSLYLVGDIERILRRNKHD